MTWIFKEKWLWITVIAITCVVTIPLIIVFLILNLPSELKIVATILIFVSWGIAAAYKDWIKSKRAEEEKIEKSKPY